MLGCHVQRGGRSARNGRARGSAAVAAASDADRMTNRALAKSAPQSGRAGGSGAATGKGTGLTATRFRGAGCAARSDGSAGSRCTERSTERIRPRPVVAAPRLRPLPRNLGPRHYHHPAGPKRSSVRRPPWRTRRRSPRSTRRSQLTTSSRTCFRNSPGMPHSTALVTPPAANRLLVRLASEKSGRKNLPLPARDSGTLTRTLETAVLWNEAPGYSVSVVNDAPKFSGGKVLLAWLPPAETFGTLEGNSFPRLGS